MLLDRSASSERKMEERDSEGGAERERERRLQSAMLPSFLSLTSLKTSTKIRGPKGKGCVI